MGSLRPGVSALLLVLLTLAAAGCSKAPEIPRLRSSPVGMERFVLREGLAVKDVRELFRAVNQEGRLDALKRYFELASDESLRSLGTVVDRHLYREVFSEDGFVPLLENRDRKRAFSRLRERVAGWLREPTGGKERDALLAAVALDGTPELLRRAIGLVDTRWAAILKTAGDAAGDGYRETHRWPEPPPFEPAELVADLRRLLADETAAAAFDAMLAELRDRRFPGHAMSALREARETRGMPAFEGFGYGLARMLRTAHAADAPEGESRLVALLKLVRLLDAPSAGLFREAAATLRDQPDLAREFATLFQADLSVSVEGLVRDVLLRPRPEGGTYGKRFWIPADPAKPTTEELTDQFATVRVGIQGITGAPRTPGARDYFIANLPLFVNSYALVRWIQAAVAANAATLGALPEARFAEAIWDARVRVPAFRLNYSERKEGKYQVPPAVKADLLRLELGPFVAALEAAVREDGFGTWLYDFRAANDVTFRQAFAGAVRTAHLARPFGDSAIFLRDLLFRVTHATPGMPLTLEGLETANLLDGFHRGLQALPPEGWHAARRLLFEQFKLADPTETSTRDLILSLFRNRPTHGERVAGIFDRLPAFVDFDTPDEGVDSPFALYHRALRWIPGTEVRPVGMLLAFVTDQGILDKSATTARFPALHSLVRGGRPLARATHFLSSIAEADAIEFRRPFDALFAGTGPRLSREALRSWLDREPEGAAGWLRKLADGKLAELLDPDILDSPEREWLRRFVERGDLRRLWDFFRQYGSRRDLARLAADLRALSASGYLGDAFRLLMQVQNERVRELARVLDAWDRSGELGAFAAALERVLRIEEGPS